MTERLLTVLSGPMPHHLDHLAPFAWVKNAPLWVEDPLIANLAKHYYPQIKLIEGPFSLQEVADTFDTIVVSTKSAPAQLRAIADSFKMSHLKFAYLPHGQSDKGLTDPLMRSIEHADIAYIYGKLQHERIIEFGANQTIGHIEMVGNFRKRFYETFQEFQDQVTTAEIFSPLKSNRPTYLYAPTWSNTSHLANIEALIAHFPKEMNLIIKLHPLIEKIHPAHAFFFQSQDLAKPNLRVIDTFPLIYPLLAKIDGYIGEDSAVGYDFLTFNRPMFFLAEDNLPLYECGIKTPDIKSLLQNLQKPQNHLAPIRQHQIDATWA